jgi:hypothetical protein
VKKTREDGVVILNLHETRNTSSGYGQLHPAPGDAFKFRDELWVRLIGPVPGVKGRWLVERAQAP